MSLEIERKFLVTSMSFKSRAESFTHITQGYLSLDPERVVRIRVRDDKAYITIKGKSNKSGLSRFEWEQEIMAEDAYKLLELSLGGVIDKVRYIVDYKDFIYEVDEFFGENAGLVVAEIELESENQEFEKPDWLGAEVTGDKKYYNSQLMRLPYLKW
ncbi:MAG: CYTH domain-containing protein [Rikenellaceae bacterium]